jgi:membrane-associated phospholipid phosphatase
MRWLSPFERRQQRRKRLIILALFLAGLAIAHLLDRPLFTLFHNTINDTDRWQRADWVQFFRAAGFLPTWLFIAAAFILADRVTNTDLWVSGRRGIPLALAAALAGLAAEITKLIVSRERPYIPRGHDTQVAQTAQEITRLGEHIWHAPFSSLWSDYNAGLGMPSSHAAVAFGGAFMLIRLCPPLWPVALIAALGCAYTRIATGAHFLSDVYVAAWLAYLVAAFIDHHCPPRAQRDDIERIAAARSRW